MLRGSDRTQTQTHTEAFEHVAHWFVCRLVVSDAFPLVKTGARTLDDQWMRSCGNGRCLESTYQGNDTIRINAARDRMPSHKVVYMQHEVVYGRRNVILVFVVW